MIGPREAMDAITAHLATKGIETGRSVTWLEGSAPIMVTKSYSESIPRHRIFLAGAVKTCCGPQHEPDDWEHEADRMRRSIKFLREKLRERGLDKPRPELRFLGRDKEVYCMAIRGAVVDHVQQLKDLSKELGIGIIAIDGDLNVESAGL